LTSPARRLAGHLIRRACRRLPEDIRDERYREWTAELPAIFHDPDIRIRPHRSARALRYAAGLAGTARRLSQPATSLGARARRLAAWSNNNPLLTPVMVFAQVAWVTRHGGWFGIAFGECGAAIGLAVRFLIRRSRRRS
jgi:hypothetical protein